MKFSLYYNEQLCMEKSFILYISSLQQFLEEFNPRHNWQESLHLNVALAFVDGIEELSKWQV